MTTPTKEPQAGNIAATIAAIEQFGATGLTGLFGIRIVDYEVGRFATELDLRDELLLHAGGLLHAGTSMTLADSTAGWGCLVSLPAHIGGFTTIEGKTNFIATARSHDVLLCSARLIHNGRSTQVWDAEVLRKSDERLLATYRCTQSLIEQARQ